MTEEAKKPLVTFASRELVLSVFYDEERGIVTFSVSKREGDNFVRLGRIRVARTKVAVAFARIIRDAKAELVEAVSALEDALR